MAACGGESEEERLAREQARMDSLRAVEQAKVAAMMAQMQDSVETSSEMNDDEMMEESSNSGDSRFSENGRFVVQVGAWRSEDKAQGFVNSLSDRNYPSAFVVKTGDESKGDVWFRVRIGFFDTKADAEAFGSNLASELNTGFWVANR